MERAKTCLTVTQRTMEQFSTEYSLRENGDIHVIFTQNKVVISIIKGVNIIRRTVHP